MSWKRSRRGSYYDPVDAPPEHAGGRVCGILSCVFGGVAFVLLPIAFAAAGLTLGIISLSLCRNRTLGTIGTALSAAAMILWLLVGFLFLSLFFRYMLG